jgi:hypothetical protein
MAAKFFASSSSLMASQCLALGRMSRKRRSGYFEPRTNYALNDDPDCWKLHLEVVVSQTSISKKATEPDASRVDDHESERGFAVKRCRKDDCAKPQILYSRFMVRSQADTPLFSVPSPDQK